MPKKYLLLMFSLITVTGICLASQEAHNASEAYESSSLYGMSVLERFLCYSIRDGLNEWVPFLLEKWGTQDSDTKSDIEPGKPNLLPYWGEHNNINKPVGNTHWTPLHWAAQHGNIGVVRFLIEGKADLEVRDAKHRTPLHVAALNGRIAVARMLIGAGADIHAQDCDGRTFVEIAPARWASKKRELKKMCDMAPGRDSDRVSQHSSAHSSGKRDKRIDAEFDPYRTAAVRGDFGTIRFLEEREGRVNGESARAIWNKYRRPYWSEVAKQRDQVIIESQDEHSTDVPPRADEVARGDLDTVQELQDEHSSTDAPSLTDAVARGDLDAIRLLMERGERVDPVFAREIRRRYPEFDWKKIRIEAVKELYRTLESRDVRESTGFRDGINSQILAYVSPLAGLVLS